MIIYNLAQLNMNFLENKLNDVNEKLRKFNEINKFDQWPELAHQVIMPAVGGSRKTLIGICPELGPVYEFCDKKSDKEKEEYKKYLLLVSEKKMIESLLKEKS